MDGLGICRGIVVVPLMWLGGMLCSVCPMLGVVEKVKIEEPSEDWVAGIIDGETEISGTRSIDCGAVLNPYALPEGPHIEYCMPGT